MPDDAARGETIEKELDLLIERRALKTTAEQRRVEDLWRDSEREHRAKVRERNRWEWIRFFERMARSHAATSEDYARRAQALLEEEVRAV